MVFRGEKIVVVCFALLGFLGSFYLYRTGSPSILVSIFLATGVASLIYGFLGGLEGATFVWGALKLGGTAAALFGMAVGVDFHLQKESPSQLFPKEGLYEWQWGGGPWKGYVEVGTDGTAKLKMNHYYQCGDNWTSLLYMEQSGEGKAEWTDNHMKLRVKIPFQYVKYDASCNRIGLSDVQILEGELSATPALAGKIHYRPNQNDPGPIGDMILVKTISGIS